MTQPFECTWIFTYHRICRYDAHNMAQRALTIPPDGEDGVPVLVADDALWQGPLPDETTGPSFKWHAKSLQVLLHACNCVHRACGVAPPPRSLCVSVSCTTWSIGKAKAPVLPLPVSAATMTSPPPRIRGMDSDWTGVGSLHKNSFHPKGTWQMASRSRDESIYESNRQQGDRTATRGPRSL